MYENVIMKPIGVYNNLKKNEFKKLEASKAKE